MSTLFKKFLIGISGLSASSFMLFVGYQEFIEPSNMSRSQQIINHAVNLQGHPEAKTIEQNDRDVILK